MRIEIPKELRHLRPVDRSWHYIADCPKPHKPGPLWPKQLICMVFGLPNEEETREDCE